MKTVKLKDISINNRGYYGIGASAVDYDENKFTYLRITDINDDGSLNKNGLMSVDDEKSDQYLLEKNDIVFARTGASTGRNYFYDGEINNMVYAGFLIKFSLNPELVNPKFVKYYCLSQKYKDWIFSSLTGSTRPNINEKQLSEMPIELSDRFYQDKVVEILDSIAQKIQLNNETNNNLYEFSNSIFKKWFIQFEYPDFNGNLKESELGKIPEDWEIGYFDDSKLTSIIKSGVDKFEGTKKYVATADVTEKKITNYEEVSYNEKPSRANMTPRISSVWFAKMENSVKNILVDSYMKDILNNYIFSTGFMGVECINNSLYYIWNIINDDKFLQEKNSLSTGTLMAGISNSTIKNYKYLIPDQNTLHKFNEIQLNINKKIYNNSIQNEKLSQLSDTLLPKLMNGEIDLDNIEI